MAASDMLESSIAFWKEFNSGDLQVLVCAFDSEPLPLYRKATFTNLCWLLLRDCLVMLSCLSPIRKMLSIVRCVSEEKSMHSNVDAPLLFSANKFHCVAHVVNMYWRCHQVVYGCWLIMLVRNLKRHKANFVGLAWRARRFYHGVTNYRNGTPRRPIVVSGTAADHFKCGTIISTRHLWTTRSCNWVINW